MTNINDDDTTTLRQHEPETVQVDEKKKKKKKKRIDTKQQLTSSSSSFLYSKLIDSCKRKDLNSIQSIISQRPDLINRKDLNNRSLLHYTVILVLNEHDSNKKDNSNLENNNDSEQYFIEQNINCFDYITQLCDLKLWLEQDLDGLSILHLAVISSNVPLVRHILFEHKYSKKYPLVCLLDNERHSPLHWAIITSQLDIVKLLINFGGVKLAHECDLNDSTPLHYATQTKDYPKYRSQLKQMLLNFSQAKINKGSITTFNSSDSAKNNSFDLNVAYDKEQTNQTTDERKQTTTAINNNDGLKILEYLVCLDKINLECLDKDRRSPLLWAASSGNKEAIRILINNGANLLSCDSNKLTALHCAASHGFTDCIECLLSDMTNTTLANSASFSRDKLLFKQRQQLNQPDNLNCTPLFYSILSGNIDCLEILLEKGAEKDWQDLKGRTAAHFAALKGQLNSLKLLNDRKANLWLPNKQGDLPLHYAIKSGRIQVVQWLLEHSPYEHSVNAINNFGRAPIHLAIMKDNYEMAKYLIKCGSNLNQLVKVKKSCSGAKPAATSTSDYSGVSKSTSSDIIDDNSTIKKYHYETVLDMAKNKQTYNNNNNNNKSAGVSQIIELLLDNKAKSAGEVMAERKMHSSLSSNQQHSPSTINNRIKSIFDVQSIEGPSPIGFETSCSSSNSYNCLNQRKPITPADDQQQQQQEPTKIPKLSRPPKAEALPQTDSTASSALSQNSLSSVRGEMINNNQMAESNNSAKQNQQEPTTKYCRASSPTNNKPYKGGISYNNKHMNASIKCKLYDCSNNNNNNNNNYNHNHNHKSFPMDNNWIGQENDMNETTRGSQQKKRSKSMSASGNNINKRKHSFKGGGQEIITNVNVYTSPCPHCIHHHKFVEECKKCSLLLLSSSSSSGPNENNNKQSNLNEKQQTLDSMEEASNRGPTGRGSTTSSSSSSSSSSSMSTTSATGGGGGGGTTSDSETQQQDSKPAKPQRQGQLVGQHNYGLPELGGDNKITAARHHRLPPSQGYEQQLPVIMSDREDRATTSTCETASNTGEQRSPIDYYATTPTNGHDLANQYYQAAALQQAQEKPTVGDSYQQQEQQQLLTRQAEEEPRFDKTNNYYKRGTRLTDKYRDQVKSPVAEYIHSSGASSSFNKYNDEHVNYGLIMDARQQVASSRAPSTIATSSTVPAGQQLHYNRMPDFSRVKPKVDSRRSNRNLTGDYQANQPLEQHQRPAGLEPSQQRLSENQEPSLRGSKSMTNMNNHESKHQSRSVSRQTVIRTRRLSVDSVELASKVEKSIRKYKQETKLFEELQNLKRSQIRSGRANEALLVKRLVERFRHNILSDFICLETYNGPYTYKSYERYLYDQLRKLSQSNHAKLSSKLLFNHQPYNNNNNNQLVDDDNSNLQFFYDQLAENNNNYYYDNNNKNDDYFDVHDLSADLELRKVIDSSGGESEQSYILEPSGALEEIRVKEKPNSRKVDHNHEEEETVPKHSVVDRELIEHEQQQHSLDAGDESKSCRELVAETKGDIKKSEDFNSESAPLLSSRKASVSSTIGSSSRRSSIEIELDRLQNNPLKVIAGEGEKTIQYQAEILTSNIITDCLGNVSRSNSPPAPEEGAANETTTTGDDEYNNKLSTIEDNDDNEQSIATTRTGGRRRSVINIGNKMDVIYHDISIEINHAPAIEEDLPEESAISGARSEESSFQLEKEEQEEKKEEASPESVNTDANVDEQKVSTDYNLYNKSGGEEELNEQQLGEESKSMVLDNCSESDINEMNFVDEKEHSKGSVVDKTNDVLALNFDKETKTTTKNYRRASSPVATNKLLYSTDQSSIEEKSQANRENYSPMGIHSRARSIDYHQALSNQQEISVKKKIFTGYDLDEMREHFKRSKQQQESLNQGNGVVDLTNNKQQQLEDKNQETWKDRKERKSKPSRLPKERYKIRINICEIRKRWNYIKSRERIRKKEVNLMLEQYLQQQLSEGDKTNDDELLKTTNDLSKQGDFQIANDDNNRTMSTTKSQPNLIDEQHNQGEEINNKTSTNTRELLLSYGGKHNSMIATDTCFNYILLYEINKRSKSLLIDNNNDKKSETNNNNKQGSNKSSKPLNWCHKKIVKIVDVRTLKRTISLPDSVLYSNDLLKRFNILKL